MVKPLIGALFGRLIVQDYDCRPRYVSVSCSCGTTKTVRYDHLKSGRTKSCGCLRVETSKTANTVHGEYYSAEYKVYRNAIDRCYNSNNKRYADYGGRGITVSKAWLEDFNVFLADMGRRPTPQHQLERLDNELGYCKENCKWATRLEQARNKRNNVLVDFEDQQIGL